MLFYRCKCENVNILNVHWVLTSSLYFTAPFSDKQTLFNQRFSAMLPSFIIA